MSERESSFFSELKRRNVYKVAVAYVVVAWLLLTSRRKRSLGQEFSTPVLGERSRPASIGSFSGRKSRSLD